MNTNNDTTQGGGFFRLLSEHNKGRSLSELSERLVELVEAVRDTGKSGSLTLLLKITPAKKSTAEIVEITDKITANLPEHDRAVSIFFTGESGLLSRTPVEQQDWLAAAEEKASAAENDNKPASGEAATI